jgi:hypothetical protein
VTLRSLYEDIMCFSLEFWLVFCSVEVMVRSALKTWYMKAELKWWKGYETDKDEFEDLMR